DPLLRLVGPALVDPLAEQVDNAVDAREGGRVGAFQRRLPFAPLDPWVGAAGAARLAGQPDDVVAAGEKRVTQSLGDRAAGAGDEDAHRLARLHRGEGPGLLVDSGDAVALGLLDHRFGDLWRDIAVE